MKVREVETHLQAVNTSLGKNKSRMKRSDHPQRSLEGSCLCLHSEAQLPPPPPLQFPLQMMMDSHQSGDGSPKIRGPGITPRILLQDGDPLRPLGHLSLSH